MLHDSILQMILISTILFDCEVKSNILLLIVDIFYLQHNIASENVIKKRKH